MATSNNYQKIVPFIIFAAALFLLFNLIKPMITILLSSILLSYIAFPVYKRLNKKIPNQSISIILSLLVLLIIIIIPFAFLSFEVIKEGYSFQASLSNETTKGILFGFGCDSADSKVCLILNQAEKFSLEKLSKFGFDNKMQEFISSLEKKITIFILSIPVLVAKVFLTFVISFFILKDWEKILEKISGLFPMRTKTKKRLVDEFGNITHTVIYAQLFVAAVQGIVAMIGFYIFGVPFPMILGILLAFCALIPMIGTGIIWFPASLYLILSGYFSNNPGIFGKGIGLFLYGLFIISTIDNILLAKIVQSKTKVNPIIVIIGVIGGASMFGIIGIFIGPILLPLLITYFETFKERFK